MSTSETGSLTKTAKDVVQGSPEWHLQRLGKATASCFGKIMTKARSGGGLSQTALTYMSELIGERLSGRPSDELSTREIRHGNEFEPVARGLYQWNCGESGHKVELVGFVDHATIPNVGGSPDFLVDNNGLGEIKCPYKGTNHIKFIEMGELTPKVNKDYYWQCQGNLWITEREWIDFVSFHPFFPDDLKLHVCRVQRDDDAIEDLEEAVMRFTEQMEIKLAKIAASCNPNAWGRVDG